MKYNPLYHLLHPLQVDERKIILMQKKICAPKKQIIQTTHKTTIKQTFSMLIIYRVNNTTLYSLIHVIAGFDINFLTNLSIRASAILILLARNCKLLALILKCHIFMQCRTMQSTMTIHRVD